MADLPADGFAPRDSPRRFRPPSVSPRRFRPVAFSRVGFVPRRPRNRPFGLGQRPDRLVIMQDTLVADGELICHNVTRHQSTTALSIFAALLQGPLKTVKALECRLFAETGSKYSENGARKVSGRSVQAVAPSSPSISAWACVGNPFETELVPEWL